MVVDGTIKMKFALEINYPHHETKNDAENLGEFEASEILKQFNKMNWNQLQILQLQMQTGSTSFTVTNVETEQSLQIMLNELSHKSHLEFLIDSDIEVDVQKRNLFGLLKIKSKDYVAFRDIGLQSTVNCLTAFLNNDIETIIQEYQSGTASQFATSSRAYNL